MIKLSDLTELEKPLYLEISEEFRLLVKRRIFQKYRSIRQFAIQNFSKQGSHIGVILWGEQYTTINYWFRICNTLDMETGELETNILKIRGRDPNSGYITMEQIPVKFSSELALLVAHGLGDGYINVHSGVFVYNNTDLRLQRVVLEAIYKIFKTKKHNERFYKAYAWSYSKIIGDFLQLAGVPKGNKITQDYTIPEWIMNGFVDVKKAFIRALYDDESTIKVKGKELLIKFSKEESKIESLYKFLGQLRELFNEFNIEVTSIRKENIVYGKNGKTIQLVLGIHGIKNFKVFNSEIGFDHPNKKKQMNILINSYQKFKLKDGTGQKLVYKALKSSKTIYQLAIKLNISPHAVYKHLKNLETKELVTQIRIRYDEPAIWRKNG